MDLYDLIDKALAFRRHQAPVAIHLPLELRELQRATQELASWKLVQAELDGRWEAEERMAHLHYKEV